MSDFAEIQAAYLRFPERIKSLMLSTINAEGVPQASYAPFVMTSDRSIYIFVSGLSAHTQNLQTCPKAGVLFIQDEAETNQIFARQRLMYDCTVELIERHDPNWTGWADQFKTRFGNIIDMLRQLPDFQIFRLIPYAGRFVVGFGAAYAVDPVDRRRLVPIDQ